VPLEVFRQGNCITGVRFADFTVKSKDYPWTLRNCGIYSLWLGDTPPLGLGVQSSGGEHSQLHPKYSLERCPVKQVVIMQISVSQVSQSQLPPEDGPARFAVLGMATDRSSFSNYGRLPEGSFMISSFPVQ